MVETSIGEASQRRVRIATESQVDEAHTAFGHKIKTSGSTLSITFKSGVSVEIDIISPSAPAYPYVSKISITGVDYLAAVGLCGNFNGVSADDVPPYQKRVLLSLRQQLVFRAKGKHLAKLQFRIQHGVRCAIMRHLGGV